MNDVILWRAEADLDGNKAKQIDCLKENESENMR